MVSVNGINHITFAVSDLDRSENFYANLLGLKPVKKFTNGIYLTAGETWICLSSDEHQHSNTNPEYTHIAFDIADKDFYVLKEKIEKSGALEWKENKSEGKSYYFLDPDGHKLEIHVGSLQTRLNAMEQ